MNEMVTISDVMLVVLLAICECHFGKVHVVMLSTMDGFVLHLVEELVKFVLDLAHETMAIMMGHIVRIVHVSVLVEVMALEVIVWGIVVLITVEVRVMISLPIVGMLLDTVCVMMLSEMLRVMLALVLVRVVMAHVVGALGLNVMILTVLFG